MKMGKLFTIVAFFACCGVSYYYYQLNNMDAFYGWAAASTTQLYCMGVEGVVKV